MVPLLMLQSYLLVLCYQCIRYVYGTVYWDSLICLVSVLPAPWIGHGMESVCHKIIAVCLVLLQSWIWYVSLQLLVQNRRRKTKSAAQFQHALQSVMVFFLYFNTLFNMVFNMPNINIFNALWNFDIAFNMRYSFQHMLKFSTCCFNIVFYTYYSFQHALKFSTCFQHTLKYST